MLPDRRYSPSESDLIFHYCSPNTFLAICQSRKLRFSDLFSMNDFMEMHWGHRVWVQSRVELKKIPLAFLDEIDYLIYKSGIIGTPLASCFSMDGDVLSQWRAYAEDGAGFSIGFQADQLTKLPVRPLRVTYDEAQQLKEMKEIIAAVYLHEEEATEKRSQDFHNFCLHLMLDMAGFKNPGFHEEKEIRLLHALQFESVNDSLRLVDPGGFSGGEISEPNQIGWSMRQGVPIPYVDIDFTNSGKHSPMKKVVLGPKNRSRISAVEVFLETMGISGVEVTSSSTSYRL